MVFNSLADCSRHVEQIGDLVLACLLACLLCSLAESEDRRPFWAVSPPYSYQLVHVLTVRVLLALFIFYCAISSYKLLPFYTIADVSVE